jgi:hypothetical protein
MVIFSVLLAAFSQHNTQTGSKEKYFSYDRLSDDILFAQKLSQDGKKFWFLLSLCHMQYFIII